MSEGIHLDVRRPFGPSLGKVNIPESLIKKINSYKQQYNYASNDYNLSNRNSISPNMISPFLEKPWSTLRIFCDSLSNIIEIQNILECFCGLPIKEMKFNLFNIINLIL